MIRFSRLINALKHPYTEYQVTKAKRKHRKAHPECAVCKITSSFFGRKNDVHHKVPVHVAPELATDPDNLRTLCRLHHWIIGHKRNWKDFEKHLDIIINLFSILYSLDSHPELRSAKNK